MKIVQIIVSHTLKRNGIDKHRKCTLTIPKAFSDQYPKSQQFVVEQHGLNLLYVPVENFKRQT